MTKSNVRVERTNITTATRIFENNELELMLAQTVANEARLPDPHLPGIRHTQNGCKAEVRFEDVTGDSGIRKVGIRAVVKITRDHEFVAPERAVEA